MKNSKSNTDVKSKQALMFIPNLVKLLYRLIQDEAVSAADKALIIATVAYVISPWDFLPDLIPVLGQLDDLLLMALVLKRVLGRVDREIIDKYWDGSEELLELLMKSVDFAMFFLPPGFYRKVAKRAGN